MTLCAGVTMGTVCTGVTGDTVCTGVTGDTVKVLQWALCVQV